MDTASYASFIGGYEADDGYPDERWTDRFRALGRMEIGPVEAARFLLIDLPVIAETISCLSVRIENARDEIFREQTVKRVEFHTGGWSGAEDLIDAMLGQFWIGHYHKRWETGGHYYFEVPQNMIERANASRACAIAEAPEERGVNHNPALQQDKPKVSNG